jgi:hypothetical protein
MNKIRTPSKKCMHERYGVDVQGGLQPKKSTLRKKAKKLTG